jgi:phosphonate transport system ATP-binding protein
MGILDKAFTRADQLSGGQQQRVALARALTQKPKVILADEPVASLDPITTVQVMDDFAKVNKEFGITVVANMHHVDLALKYATRIIGVKDGEIVYDGPSKDIDDKTLIQIYGRSLKDDEVLGE